MVMGVMVVEGCGCGGGRGGDGGDGGGRVEGCGGGRTVDGGDGGGGVRVEEGVELLMGVMMVEG